MKTTREKLPVALVTGASHGIGRETAGLLARSGFRVFGTSRRPESTPPLPGVTFLPLDVLSSESIRACVERVIGEVGQIDVLINNAGMVGPGSASEEIDIQRVRALFETNFFGLVQVTSTVLPHMRARGQGTIINISSASGLVALPPFFSFYSASKHALEAYSEGLRYEVAPLGIRVALVEPGYTDTGIFESVQPPDHPIAAYSETRSAMTVLNRAAIHYGSRPEQTARVVQRVLRQRHTALRHPASFDALAISLLRRFLPAPLFEVLGRWMFMTWRPPRALEPSEVPAPRELGLHRVLFHGPTLQAVVRAAAGVGLGMAGLAGLQGVRKMRRRDKKL